MTTYNYPSIYTPEVQFTPADLAANRAGSLTPAQHERITEILRGRGHETTRTFRWFVVWIVLLMLVGFVIEWSRVGFDLAAVQSIALLMLGITLMLCFLLSLSWGFGYFAGRHARAGRIRHVEGIADVLIKKQRLRTSVYMRYELSLKRGRRTVKLFRLPNARSLDHFQHGQRCRVYYIPYYPFDLILSAETLSF